METPLPRTAAAARVPLSPWHVRLAPPPYTAPRDAAPGLFGPGPVPAGTLAILAPPPRDVPWPAVRQQVAALRQALPRLPVVLHLPPGLPGGLQLARRAGEFRVRGIVAAEAELLPTLRPVLGDPTDIGSDVEEWLRVRGLALPPGLAQTIAEIFRAAARGQAQAAVARRLGLGERRARARFRRAGIPSPGQWMQAARGLWAALQVQRDPDVPLLAIAHEHGYGDHSSLSQQLVRLFRRRPGALRGTLGWEWLLDDWLRAHSVAPAARDGDESGTFSSGAAIAFGGRADASFPSAPHPARKAAAAPPAEAFAPDAP